jgi:predicted transcriptional regulator
MSGTLRDLDMLAYQLHLSNVVADDGGAFDRLATILSVRAVAALTGLSACSISRFERGHDVVLSSAVKLIAWIGGVVPLDLSGATS